MTHYQLFMLVLKIHAIKIDYAGLSLSMSKAMGAGKLSPSPYL